MTGLVKVKNIFKKQAQKLAFVLICFYFFCISWSLLSRFRTAVETVITRNRKNYRMTRRANHISLLFTRIKLFSRELQTKPYVQ